MFPKSETEYLFVEMKTMPVCLRFSKASDFLSYLAYFIHLHDLPASWRYLSLPPCLHPILFELCSAFPWG